MFIVNQHKSDPTNIIISIVDEELINKTFEEGNKILDLKSKFYQGGKKTEKEVNLLIPKAKHLNVVGKKITEILKKNHLLDKVMTIDGCPYAQIVLIH